MKHWFRAVAVVAAPLVAGAGRAVAQEVHEIRMVSAGEREFRFDPSSVTVRRGDVLLFTANDGGPHSVVFDERGISAADRERLNQAMPRRAGELSSPLLTDGTEYRVIVPALAAGTYRFYCLPHKAYDMKGQFTVR